MISMEIARALLDLQRRKLRVSTRSLEKSRQEETDQTDGKCRSARGDRIRSNEPGDKTEDSQSRGAVTTSARDVIKILARTGVMSTGLAFVAACGTLPTENAIAGFDVRASSLAQARESAEERCQRLGKRAVYQGAMRSRAAGEPPPSNEHYTADYDGWPSGVDRSRFVFRCA